ncbi:RibD family protein [Actinoplanes sp. CA-030573]|uniref:RibD family protein n=1 Tax=Actinoplanes sp. CA-030573 TaxID=3239898 RepID=UPI003D8A64E2
MKNPSLPYVVVAVQASVDGRVALRRDRPLLHDEPGRRWAALRPPSFAAADAARAARHDAGAVLEGSGSMVPGTAGPLTGLPPPSGAGLHEDFAEPAGRKWFTVVDGRGRVRWTMTGNGEFDLLVLVCAATPPAYLAYLRRERIAYLVAGEERVDLEAALCRMRERLGVTTVVSHAGGGLNGALLRAGLVDEVEVIVLPALVGGLGTPTIFDGPPLGDDESPLPLRLLSAQVETDGTVLLRYAADRPETATPGPRGG